MSFLEPKNIKKIRNQLGLTQEELARVSGLTASLIAKIEAGKVDPPFSKMKSLFESIEKIHQKSSQKVGDIMSTELISVQSNAKVNEAAILMRQHAISQIPVFEDQKSVGSVSEKTIISWLSEKATPESLFKKPVKEIMDDPLPSVGKDTPVDLLFSILGFFPAVLVIKKGKVIGIVAKADLLKTKKKTNNKQKSPK